jgi:hypothetical protein
MAFDFPSSPSTGMQYISPNKIYYYDSSNSWSSTGETQSVNPAFANPFKYRTIYTHGYVVGGYKDSSPWRNVNRTVHATDVTTNLGDLLDYNPAYTDGSYSDYYQYIYASATSWPGTGNYTSSFNMITETGRTHDANWDTKNSFGYYGDVGVIINSNLTLAWILGDQTNIDKHNLVTEVMYANGAGGSSVGTAGDFVATWHGETYGWVKHSYNGSRNHKMDFATETWSSAGLSVGTDGWGKALSTKDGKAYVKNVGNIGSSTYTINDTTGSNINTGLNMPENCGEENFQTGQNWGYSLGNYNGVQNNNTHKFVHATDSITTMGSDTQPKGHAGMSSAAMATAAASVVGTLY